MMEYPATPRATQIQDFVGYTFSKEDGMSLRALYTRKKGFSRFGSRHTLIDETSPMFKDFFPLFHETISDGLAKLAKDHRWDEALFFMEWYGPQSLGGIHVPGDPMKIKIFDMAVGKHGHIVGPREFLRLTDRSYIPTPKYLGTYNWTPGFVKKVYDGEIEGASFEGVVGKAGEGASIVRAKAKTKAWLDAIKARYTPAEAEKIINS